MSPLIAALKKWLLAGMLVVVPATITILVLRWVVSSLDGIFDVLPRSWHPDTLIGAHIPGLGIIAALLLLLLIGGIASNFVGKKLVVYWDLMMGRIPVVSSIYNSVKQVSDTLFSDSGNAFRKAMLVQWPHPGCWTIAFLTGHPDSQTTDLLGSLGAEDCLSLYVPTTPNPTGGYFVMVPRKNCHELDMSVDQALKYIISMGVVAPQLLPVQDEARTKTQSDLHQNS